MRSIKERLQAMRATKQKNDQAWAAKQAGPQAREYIERVVIDVKGNGLVRYKWINTVGHVIGWYSEEELQSMRARLAATLEPPLAPGVADEIRRMVAVIDEALGDEVVPPPRPLYRGQP